MKSWQNGYLRNGVQIGSGCAGCGKYIPAAYILSDDMPPTPDYPFEEGDCPVCELLERNYELAAKITASPEDKLTERLLKLKGK